MREGTGGGADLTSRHFDCDESESFQTPPGRRCCITSPFLPRTRGASAHD
jgi:hypothetical protein